MTCQARKLICPAAQPGTLTVVIMGTGPGGSHPAPGTPGPALCEPCSPVSVRGPEDFQLPLEGEHVLVLDEDAIGSQLGQEGEHLQGGQGGLSSGDGTVQVSAGTAGRPSPVSASLLGPSSLSLGILTCSR